MKGFRYISVAVVVALCSAAAYAHGGWQKQTHEVHRPPEPHTQTFSPRSSQHATQAHPNQNHGGGPNSAVQGRFNQHPQPSGPAGPGRFNQNTQPYVRRPDSGPHEGDWLRHYSTLPPQQQQRMLEQDPQFHRLPPDQQQHLRERLNTFNALPPLQRQRVLNRMDKLGRLTPDQRHRANDLYSQFRTVDPDRRSKMMLSLRQMHGMSSEARQKWLNSPQMRRYYSPHELDLLRGMSDLGVGNGPDGPPR